MQNTMIIFWLESVFYLNADLVVAGCCFNLRLKEAKLEV